MSALSSYSNDSGRHQLVDWQPLEHQRTIQPLSPEGEISSALIVQPVSYPITRLYPMTTGLVQDLQLFSPESISSIESPRYTQPMFSDQSTLYNTRYHGSDYEGSISFGPASHSFYSHIPSTSTSFYHDDNGLMTTGFFSPAPTTLDSGDETTNYQTNEAQYVQTYDACNKSTNYSANPQLLHREGSLLNQSSPQLPQSPAISNSSLERVTARQTRSGLRRKSSKSKATALSISDETAPITPSLNPARKRRGSPLSKGEKAKVPKLTRPLSELTNCKEYVHLPVKNMETWVTRSLEERKREVERRNGYITRPMNSFMLYRSAYAERTKLWCLNNNHQIVSAVSGASWPLEPPAIREKYNTFAKLERINHQRAHPGYKFSPTKVQNMARKAEEAAAAAALEEDAQISSNLENVNLAQDRESKIRKREKKTVEKVKEVVEEYTDSLQEHGQEDSLDISSPGGALKSSYGTLNPGRVAPVCMGTTDMNGSYYQTIVRPTSGVKLANAMIEDVTIRKTAAPAGQTDLRRELQERLLANAIDTTTADAKVDPILLGHNEYHINDSEYSEEDQSYAFDLKYYTDNHSGQSSFEMDPLFHTEVLSNTFTYLPDGSKNPNCFATYHDCIMDGIMETHKYWSQMDDHSKNHNDSGHQVKYDDWLTD